MGADFPNITRCEGFPDDGDLEPHASWASSAVRSRATDIQDAFEYIVAHPQQWRTVVTFSARSNWAEFGLSTPAGKICCRPQMRNA